MIKLSKDQYQLFNRDHFKWFKYWSNSLNSRLQTRTPKQDRKVVVLSYLGTAKVLITQIIYIRCLNIKYKKQSWKKKKVLQIHLIMIEALILLVKVWFPGQLQIYHKDQLIILNWITLMEPSTRKKVQHLLLKKLKGSINLQVVLKRLLSIKTDLIKLKSSQRYLLWNQVGCKTQVLHRLWSLPNFKI